MNNNLEFDKYKFREEICSLKLKITKEISNTYVWVDIAYYALCSINPENLEYIYNGKLKRKTDYSEGLKNAKEVELYYSSFVYVYSKLEDFFIKSLKIINKYIPNAITDNEINNFNNMSYDKQLELLNDKLKLNMKEERLEKLLFIRSLRNIIVHNNGYVNKNFLNLTQYKFDYKIGERIYIDKYFNIIIKDINGLTGTLTHLICERYNLPNSNEYNKHIGKIYYKNEDEKNDSKM